MGSVVKKILNLASLAPALPQSATNGNNIWLVADGILC